MTELGEIELALDEFEAIRLADFEGLYQAEAAREMGISRPTFSRVVAVARQKVAEALVQGKALKIQGGGNDLRSIRTPGIKPNRKQ